MSTSTRGPRVSVVMPCYRHAAFVEAAAQSVLRQTFADLELIAVDDASGDGTVEILRGLRDPRLRLHENATNLGAHASLNLGVARARGEFVTILNSDDVFHPDRLEKLLAFAERERADVCATNVALIDAAGRRIDSPTYYWNAWLGELTRDLASHRDALRTLLLGNVLVTTSNLFATREAMQAVGPFADLRYSHDYDWILRACVAGRAVRFDLASTTLDYRLHGSNTILEAPLDATKEVHAVLLATLPKLAHVAEAPALENLARQLSRSAADIETASARGPLGRLRQRLRRVYKRFALAH